MKKYLVCFISSILLPWVNASLHDVQKVSSHLKVFHLCFSGIATLSLPRFTTNDGGNGNERCR